MEDRVRPLEELRERTEQMLLSRPAETTSEMEWLVGELEKTKQVLIGLIDHLILAEE